MRCPSLTRGALLALISLASSGALRAQSDQEAFFGLTNIWDVHVTIEKEAWKGLFPTKSDRWTRMFGTYPYQKVDVTIGDHTIKNVGFRMKGNATFAATAGTLKRSFKLDFNRYDPKGRFLGLKKLNLQSNAVDATQIKEAVSYQAYRDAGMLACRTAFARLYVTMPGTMDRAYIGLYTLVEQVDQDYAKRTHGKGLIAKPEGETLGYRGPEWNDEYMEMYRPRSGFKPELAQRLIAAANAYDEIDDAQFVRNLEAALDVEQLLYYTALTTVLNSADSPLNVPDNYFLLVPEKTKKVVFIPWDFNWSLGAWSRMLNLPVDDLSIMRPSTKAVFTRVLGIPKYERRYRWIVQKLIDGPCSAKALTASIRRAHATVKEAIDAEAGRPKIVTDAGVELGGEKRPQPWLSRLNDIDVEGLVAFAEAREKSVRDQLAGTSKGRPAGRAWGGRRPPRGNHLRTILAGTGALDASREQFPAKAVTSLLKNAYEKLDADGSSSVNSEECVQAARRRLSKNRRTRMTPDPEITAKRFGARALQSLDTNGDGSIALDEWTNGVTALLPYWDRDRDGAYTRRELDLVRLDPKDR